MQQKQTSLVWFGNNLRSQDNLVLKSALSQCEPIIGLYCICPSFFKKTAYGFKKMDVYRTKFLLETLSDLKHQLSDLNITLLVYYDEPENIIPKLTEQFNISKIFFETEWTAEENLRIQKVKKNSQKEVKFHSYYDQFLFHPEDIPFQKEDIPMVFTQFRKVLEKSVQVRPTIKIEPQHKSEKLQVECKIPTLKELGFVIPNEIPHTAFPFKGGETNATNRLNDYFFKTKGLGVYKKTRNGLVGKNYSSKFSAWLANGSLSARQIYWKVKEFESELFSNESTYWMVFELIWRDFFKYVSLKYGNSIFKIDGILKHQYRWSSNKKFIDRWINGTTDDDFINANMIELKQTGWMSNRGRQNVASYFSKNQKLDWRIGAAYFESMLIDYDVHSNYGNWMYVSGVGNDPRDRVFNVKTQAENYDPNHSFRKLWLQTKLF